MKKILAFMMAACVFWQANAAETSLANAEATARKENKIVLLDFTGSDWCIWCKRFKAEVLDTPEFQQYAAKNAVLVELDFPRHTEQAAALKAANTALKNQFAIHGFPTFIALDKDGKEIGRQVGYAKGGPKAFIAKLEKFRGK
jgi:thioredoxin-related protein